MSDEGRVVLLTGAGGGLGREIALKFASRGDRLALVHAPGEPIDEVERVCRTVGSRGTMTVEADLSRTADLAQLVVAVESKFGRIDVLVNNAGMVLVDHLENLNGAAIERIMAVNLLAPMLLSRWVLPGMIERDHGHIVNMASIAGLGVSAYTESYNASKHGLVGFSRALRLSLKADRRNIGVSVICPGFVSKVGMFEALAQRAGGFQPRLLATVTPEAVASAVLRAIAEDEPQVVVSAGRPLWPVLVLQALSPRLAERFIQWVGADRTMAGLVKGPPS